MVHVPTGWAPPPGRLARLRGVRAAGWMGRMPAAGGVWTALGLWRGVMEVSVVGIGSVNLPNQKKEHFGLCVNDGKYYKSVIEPLKCSPGLRLALLCCCRFTGFDRFREFQRKSRILHDREKGKELQFLQPPQCHKCASCFNQLVGQAENVRIPDERKPSKSTCFS